MLRAQHTAGSIQREMYLYAATVSATREAGGVVDRDQVSGNAPLQAGRAVRCWWTRASVIGQMCSQGGVSSPATACWQESELDGARA